MVSVRAVITAFEPGALQLALFIERAGPDLWHLYAITRVSSASSSLVTGSPSSYLNRLDAFQRYLAGTPMRDLSAPNPRPLTPSA